MSVVHENFIQSQSSFFIIYYLMKLIQKANLFFFNLLNKFVKLDFS